MLKVHELLNQFGLTFDLNPGVLSLEIPGEYNSLKTQMVELRFNNYTKGYLDYGIFETYIFEGENCSVMIAPDCNFEHVSFSERLDSGRVTGYSFDEFGVLSVRV
ncbi:MAG: hypothetical protein IJQ68_06970 [Methanobrevibacter sp.]|uniref:hypothetical protein n=1 Tax=Methanobrevibacter sp. TaxID=66852 RepID=UPI0025CEA3DA|nr:hypothetical protein [Methanobrevibacter sp.]MBR0271713.1 hypothetical protein [Methanobrevibacter sp.]